MKKYMPLLIMKGINAEKISRNCLPFEILSMSLSFLSISYEKLLFKKKNHRKSFCSATLLKKPFQDVSVLFLEDLHSTEKLLLVLFLNSLRAVLK